VRPYSTQLASNADRQTWDAFVGRQPHANPYLLYGWCDVIQSTYGHETHYLMLTGRDRSVLGVLPLVHLRHFVFGNRLVSLPFADAGGVLAVDREAEEALLSAARDLCLRAGVGQIELRQEVALVSWGEASPTGSRASVARRKVRMLMTLPESSEGLRTGFKAKLRSQINRPLKEGCSSKVGGLELLEDFYKVFLINMRDLGSPVHSKELMRHVLEAFPERSRIFAVYHAGEPIAASLVIGYNGVLRNPWASSDRRYASMSPNMLLYSRMLEYACESGYRTFDFGRSTPGEGTYRFKQQWGAQPAPLHWYTISADGSTTAAQDSPSERFNLATQVWKKLPVRLTKVLGPRIRKHISL
jgi:FemAB-related protein (PEP-CTERM system-associated)